MVPEVLIRLLGRTLDMRPARLDGYARFRVKGAVYPGIVATEGAGSVNGIVLSGMNQQDWETFDRYEGEEYSRETVRVFLPSGDALTVDTYVYRDDSNLTDEPWDDREVINSLKELGLGE